MDSREFDDLIKDSLDGFSQLPEQEVKKAIFGKLFYQNLWVFHKMKLMASIVMIGGSAFFINSYLDNSSSDNPFQTNSSKDNNELFVDNTIDSDDGFIETDNSIEIKSSKTESSDKSIIAQINNEYDDSKEQSNSFSEELDVQENNAIDKKTNSNEVNDPKAIYKNKEDNNTLITNAVTEDINELDDKTALDPNNKIVFESSNKGLAKSEGETTLPVNKIEKIKILDKVNTLSIAALHTCIPLKEITDVPAPDFSDYANEHTRGFTFDAYFSPYNRADVDNVLDPIHNDYWWDFYKEHQMERSGIGGGVNISYNYRNFKLNSGLNFDQVYDYKPQYEYFTDQDSIFAILNGNIVLLNVELISGLQVFGPADSSGVAPLINTDTTVVFYVDPNDDNLLNEISKNANRYNYLRIPLTLGYEFKLKRASFEINAGVEYTRLMKANGISYKNGYVDVGIRPVPYYYYEDMVATTFQNNMNSIKVNNWNYVANAIVRVRVSRSLDLFSSFRFQYNTNSIMADDYLLQKTYKKYGVNVGVTYHLNRRLSLKEYVTPSWD